MHKIYKLKAPYNSALPGDHAQLECLRRALAKKRFGIFFQQRVGKTRVAIDFIGKNIVDGAERVLVLCPLCAQASWKVQFSEYLGQTHKGVKLSVVQDTKAKLPRDRSAAHIVLSTYERAVANSTEFVRWKPDVVVFDEAHLLKNRTSRRSRMAYHVAKEAKGVLGLTGTPYSNRKYADLFGLWRAINPEVFGTRWVDFEDEFCIKGGYMGREIVDYKNEDKLLELVNENSMRVVRKDVMDEPEQEDVCVHVEFTPEERSCYDQMKREFILFLEEQPKVTADLITTQRLKLQQITSGTVKDDEGEHYTVTKSKLEVTLDLIGTLVAQGKKVVVVCRYVADVLNLFDQRAFVASMITGGKTAKEREDTVLHWQKYGSVLIIQEQTMSMGVDLSQASDMIFYSWGEDSITHSQVRDRVLGRGQKEEMVHYYYMMCNKTIDESMYKSLKKNISFAAMAADWRKWVE